MAFALRDGVSFCVASGRVIFLDVVADRYFCLRMEAERVFLSLVDEKPGTADAAELKRLVSKGLLIEANGASGLEPCKPVEPAGASFLEEPVIPASFWQIAAAFLELASANALLRRRGLSGAIAAVVAAKQRNRPSTDATAVAAVAATIATAFAQTGFIATTHDKCLPRSLAVMRRLARRGVRGTLVMGVKLAPFRAHCWVQYDSTLINDRIDNVHDFTPILVV